MGMALCVEHLKGDDDYVSMTYSNAYMVWNALGMPLEDDQYYWEGNVGQLISACDTYTSIGIPDDYVSYRIQAIRDLCIRALFEGPITQKCTLC